MAGGLPDLVSPNQPPNSLNPTPAAVGRQFDYSRKLGARRGFRTVPDQAVANAVNQALAHPVTGLSALVNQALADPVTGLGAVVNQALAHPVTGLAAVVNQAMTPISRNIECQQAKSHNHQSIGRRNGSLLTLSDPAGNMPAPGQFPRSVEELSHFSDGAVAVRAGNHTRMSYLLNFYDVIDEVTVRYSLAVFSASFALPAQVS
ncbi:hypothetical protein KFL_001340290 [Klebsormidium nitens]|uniref:Uncharacterized protein n=1 Tax=Klebsormidium nitens TaxID=105231 RepID=A0A1Y1HWP7_KLENI|nr:hypothetical protein KFL_001340290 [Klebsormidium nitens]|eukprot:GAQ83074.1 hypothetical protein KFL_001340290 [Klebsormidium nitens]